MIQFKLTWTPSVSPDVVKQVLHMAENGTARADVDLLPTVAEYDTEAVEGVVFDWSVDTWDDATPPNVTPGPVQTFTVADTIPPEPATGFGVTVLGEN